jgi:hypothetical protein
MKGYIQDRHDVGKSRLEFAGIGEGESASGVGEDSAPVVSAKRN